VDLLEKLFKNFDNCIVALSGGFDSAVVAYLAKNYLGEDRIIAATCVNNHIFRYQIRNAIEIAAKLNIRWFPFYVDPEKSDIFNANQKNRCYICKSRILKKLVEIKNDMGTDVLLDGTKSQDLHEDRPGLVALKEYGVLSPMLDPNFDAKHIIHAKKFYNYARINFVSESCKATRIMEGELTQEKLDLVENIEDALRDQYPQIRARIYMDHIKFEFKNNKTLSNKDKDYILEKVKYLVNSYTVTFS
jgi:uncharacterized protein (TIGR00268 family)